MDRASASEAGNMGSTPVGRMIKNPAFAGFFNHSRSKQTALLASEVEGRSVVFVWAALAAKGKNREARPEGIFRQENDRRGLPPSANIFVVFFISALFSLARIPRRCRAATHSILRSFTPRNSAFYFEKSTPLTRSGVFTALLRRQNKRQISKVTSAKLYNHSAEKWQKNYHSPFIDFSLFFTLFLLPFYILSGRKKGNKIH